jgi:plasmid stabilization system protein ParE
VTKPVRPTAEAEEEIRSAIQWYRGESSELGQQLWDELQKVVELVSERPAIGNIVRRPRVGGLVRRMPLRRFPYFIIYRERDDSVEMIAFAHMSRRPRYWIVRTR